MKPLTPKTGLLFAALLALPLAGCLFGHSDVTAGLGSSPATCETAPCGANGGTMKVCTTTGSSGECGGISYDANGKTFNCNSCTDCTEAATQAAEACTGTVGSGSSTGSGGGGSPWNPGGGTSGSGSGSSGGGGGGGGVGGTTCSQAVSCGTSGVTYDVCTTLSANGTCGQIAYQTSDGQTFTCAACTDCTQAAQDVTSYCTSGGGGGGGGGGGQQCGSTVCGSAATCCTCSGQPICFSLQPGQSCTDYNCS